MKKSFITYALTFLSLTCYANSFPQVGEMSLFSKILIGVFLITLIAVILIFVDNSIKNNKKSDEKRDKKDEKKLNDFDKSKINENIDLKKDKEELTKKIERLNKELDALKKENTSLKNRIVELKTSLSRSDMHSDDPNKQEDNNEKTDAANSNNTNYSSLVRQFNFIELAVINGNLVKAESEQTTYYRSWREKGQILFEFVNNDRTRKAINNRTIIIEPFCIKLESSKSPDNSEEIETKTPGILNDDFTLKKKAEIIYK